MLHYQGINTWYTYFLHVSNMVNIDISKSYLNRYKPHTLNSKLNTCTYFSKISKKNEADTRHKLIIENGKLRTYLEF